MIDITYEPGKRVSIRGHAGYAEKGKDIVCAAISTLYCTMIMAKGIGGYTDDDEMVASVQDYSAKNVFEVMCEGMKAVAKQYPKHCSFRVGKIDLSDY